MTRSRFEPVPEDEDVNNFVVGTRSKNTTMSTKHRATLLNQYKVEAFGWIESIDELNEERIVKLIQCFLQMIKRADGESYERGSLSTIYYSIKRHLVDLEVSISPLNWKALTSHLGAACKMSKRAGNGNVDNALADMVTTSEVRELFIRKLAGTHSPAALWNARVIICRSLGRRTSGELRETRYGDVIIEIVDGNQFITLDKKRLSKTRQGEDRRNMPHGVGVLAEDAGNKHFCPVATFLKFCDMRPESSKVADAPMFMNFTQRVSSMNPRKAYNDNSHLWYTNH